MMTLSDRSQTQWRQRRVSLGAMRTNKHYSDWQLALLFSHWEMSKSSRAALGSKFTCEIKQKKTSFAERKPFYLSGKITFFLLQHDENRCWPLGSEGLWGVCDGIWSSRYNGPSWIRRRLDHFKFSLQSSQYVSIYQRFNMKHNVKVVRWHWNATLNAVENHRCGHCQCCQ